MGGSPSLGSYNCDDLTDRIIPASASFGLAIVSETFSRIAPDLQVVRKTNADDEPGDRRDGHVFEIDESWETYADPVYGDRWPRDRNAARVRFLR
jgi:hypothetical protein